jgi:hypothetical protein
LASAWHLKLIMMFQTQVTGHIFLSTLYTYITAKFKGCFDQIWLPVICKALIPNQWCPGRGGGACLASFPGPFRGGQANWNSEPKWWSNILLQSQYPYNRLYIPYTPPPPMHPLAIMTCILEVVTTHVDCILWPGPTIIVAIINCHSLTKSHKKCWWSHNWLIGSHLPTPAFEGALVYTVCACSVT